MNYFDEGRKYYDIYTFSLPCYYLLLANLNMYQNIIYSKYYFVEIILDIIMLNLQIKLINLSKQISIDNISS